MWKENTDSLTGNDRFEGFCIDLIHELSKILGFNYTFVIQKNGANGNFDEATGKWDGLIGAVNQSVSIEKYFIATTNSR